MNEALVAARARYNAEAAKRERQIEQLVDSGQMMNYAEARALVLGETLPDAKKERQRARNAVGAAAARDALRSRQQL